MIVVRFTSGLGNQMFQYSFYRLMQETYPNTEVKADLTWFYANNDHHGYELHRIFEKVPNTQFHIQEASKKEILAATGLVPNLCSRGFGKEFEKFRRYPNRILREFTQSKRAPFMIDQLTGTIENKDQILSDGTVKNEMFEKVMHLDTKRNWYLTGFWIEEKYYRNRMEALYKELVFPALASTINRELAARIQSENSVSIHVRRGDYLVQYADMFAVLDRGYYEKAVHYIENHVTQPSYFIFSDDSTFVEKEFDWLSNKTIVINNKGDDSYCDMQLMSLCHHNIIANSTFSQWGALLNTNENHIVIYPAEYLKQQDNELKTLPGWVRISTTQI